MSGDLQAARIVAGTLTLLAREIRQLGPPVDLWTPPLSPEFIRQTAAEVSEGRSLPLWVQERHPARGLAIYSPSPWESEFFGFGCARLRGPYMVVEDQLERQSRVSCLARQAVELGRRQGQGMLVVKTAHDPAFLRGFLAEGFVLAEIGLCLSRAIDSSPAQPESLPPAFSFIPRSDLPALAAEVVEDLGDFFYDGHYRHDHRPGPQSAASLWSRVAEEDLSGAAEPALLLWDRGRDRVAGLATARCQGSSAALSILTVDPAYRGRGLGRLLLAEMLRRLAGRAEELRVETAAYNRPALALYLAEGLNMQAPLAALHYHFQ